MQGLEFNLGFHGITHSSNIIHHGVADVWFGVGSLGFKVLSFWVRGLGFK